MPCRYCAGNFHELCGFPNRGTFRCCCILANADDPDRVVISGGSQGAVVEDINPDTPSEADDDSDTANHPMDYFKSGRHKSNTISAGRKRAARAHEIPAGTQCEWAGLKKAGGGLAPIVGCRNKEENLALDMHHGPDKSTQRNERPNVHFICKTCHNRWHTLNDDFYGIRPQDNSSWLVKEEYMPAFQAHDANTQATDDDHRIADEFFTGRKVWKARE